MPCKYITKPKQSNSFFTMKLPDLQISRLNRDVDSIDYTQDTQTKISTYNKLYLGCTHRVVNTDLQHFEGHLYMLLQPKYQLSTVYTQSSLCLCKIP